MFALTRSFGQMSAVLAVVGTALSSAVALHVTQFTHTRTQRVRD